MRRHFVSLIAAIAISCFGLAGTAAALPIPTPDFAWLYDVQTLGTTPAYYGPHDGIIVNTPTLSTDTPFGYSGNRSFSFVTANDDYVRVNDAPDLRPGTGPWSLSMWFKTSGSQFSALAAKQDSSVGNFWVLFPGNAFTGTPSLKLSAYIQENGSDYYAAETTSNVIDPVTPLWHHVAMVREATATDDQFKLYIDGSLAALTTLSVAGTNPPDQRDINNTQPWLFGRNRVDNAPFIHYTGLMDEVAMWNEALTPADVLWLSQNSLVPPVPEPSTFALLGLGLVGMAVRRQRRRRGDR